MKARFEDSVLFRFLTPSEFYFVKVIPYSSREHNLYTFSMSTLVESQYNVLESKVLPIVLTGVLLVLVEFHSAEAGRRDPPTAAFLSAIFPGGGHFYLGESGKGLIYLSSELSLVGAGYCLDESLEKEPREELNFLYILALKEHELGIFTAYRNARLLSGNKKYTIPPDPSPISKLFLSPFLGNNLVSLEVYGFALIGAALAYGQWLANKPQKRFNQISDVYIMGGHLDRGRGFSTYEALLFSISLSAAVGEEAAWRGVVQTEYEESLGRVKGLVAASLMFGLSHLLNPNVANRYREGGVATAGGMYLGWLYQRNGYCLSRSIAAHFWYNILAGTTAFLLDPENNPLGIKVEFKF